MKVYGRTGVGAWSLGQLEASPKKTVRGSDPLRTPEWADAPRTRAIDAEPSSSPRALFDRVLQRFARYVVEVAGVLLPTPALEALGLTAQRESTAAFLQASELADLARAYSTRAQEAERASILATDPIEKHALEWHALGRWVTAARGMPPLAVARDVSGVIDASPDRGARLSLERLATFAETKSEKRTAEALQAFFEGDLRTGRAKLAEAERAADGGESLALGRLHRRASHAEIVEHTVDLLEGLATARDAADPTAARARLAERARQLGADAPAHALDLVSIELEAEGPSARDPLERITRAHARTAATSEREGTALLGQRALLEIAWTAKRDVADARTRARALAEDPSVPAEHRQLGHLAEADLAARAGDLEGAIRAARAVRTEAGGPERRALASLMLATLLDAKGDPLARAEADHALSRALEELGFEGHGGAERLGRKLSKIAELTVRLLEGDDLDGPTLTRPLSEDAKRLIDELLLARAGLAERRGDLDGASRMRSALHDRELQATSGDAATKHTRYARLFALTPLAKSARVPFSILLDRERAVRASDAPASFDPMSTRLTLARAAMTYQARTPESLLSATHREGGSPLDAAIAGVLTSKRGGSVFAASDREEHRTLLRRALGRELVESWVKEREAHVPSASELVAAMRAADTSLFDAAKTAAMGLARPGDTRDLRALAELFGAPVAIDASARRPSPRAVLAAATELGRASHVLDPTPVRTAPDALWSELTARLSKPDVVRSHASIRAELESLGLTARGGDLYSNGETHVKVERVEVGPEQATVVSLGRGSLDAPAFGPRDRVVTTGKLTFSGEVWSLFEHGRERELARYQRARRSTRDARRLDAIVDLASLRSFVSIRGRPPERLEAKRAKMEKLKALEDRASELLEGLRAKGKLPKGFYVMVDGIDAASKTSNGREIVHLLERAGLRSSERSFKAPTAEERAQPYLQRFDAHRPKEGEVFFADRSPLGDFAYAPGLSPERREAMGQEFRAWQRSMRDEGIEVVKLLFYPGDEQDEREGSELPPLWRPMYTFGKRQARAEIARDLLAERRAAGAREGELPPGLVEAAHLGPGPNDLAAFQNGVDVHHRFEEAADLTAGDTESPWTLIHTSSRKAGRIAALETFVARLEALDRAS